MEHFGDFYTNATIRYRFNTVDANDDLVTIAGGPTIAVYKDGDAAEFSTGTALTVDYDGRTGLHEVEIDGAHASFSSGGEYVVVFTAGTVDGVALANRKLFSFSIASTSRAVSRVPGALLDLVDGVETGWTLRQVLRLMAAVLLGKTTNGQKTFRDLGDTKDRVVSTLDADGDRTALTRDAT